MHRNKHKHSFSAIGYDFPFTFIVLLSGLRSVCSEYSFSMACLSCLYLNLIKTVLCLCDMSVYKYKINLIKYYTKDLSSFKAVTV